MKKESLKSGVKKIRDLRVGTFFKFTARKLLVDFLISIGIVFLFFTYIPWANQVFSQETFFRKIVDTFSNALIYMLFLYPLSCYLSLLIFKRERKE